MSGWVTPPQAGGPAGPGPIVGWVAPTEPEGLGIGEIRREGWRLTRDHLGAFAGITLVPVVLLDLMVVPIWLSAGRSIEGMVTFWTTIDMARYRNDPEALQRDLRAVMQPSTDLAVLGTVGTGLAFIVMMLGVAALSAAALEASAGRRPSIGAAFSAIGEHLSALVLPALLLGIGYILVLTPLTLNQAGFTSVGFTPGGAALSAGLSFLVLILEVAAVYLAVRWSVYFQAVVGEGLGFRASLARSSALTAGVRIKIGLILIVWTIVIGIVVGLVGLLVGLVVGVATGSMIVGLVAYSVALSICGLVYLPFYVAMLTVIYRRRIEQTSPAEPTGEAAQEPTGPA